MADTLNQDAQDKTDEMCQKISVVHSLDADIQEELPGHMEDKALGYLNGQEPITEDDALLLVREHFSYPAMIKSMLQDVHVLETQVSLARRLMAIVALSMAISIVVGIFMLIAGSVTALLQFRGSGVITTRVPYSIAMITMMIMVLFINWKVLVHWKTQIRSGKRPWFRRWRARNIVGLVAGLMSIQLLIPSLLVSYNTVNQIQIPDTFAFFGIGLRITLTTAHAIIGLWWCDRPPRLAHTTSKALLVWILSILW